LIDTEFTPVEFIEMLLTTFENSSGVEIDDINTAVVLKIDYPFTLENVFHEEIPTTTEATTTEADDEHIAELEAQVVSNQNYCKKNYLSCLIYHRKTKNLKRR